MDEGVKKAVHGVEARSDAYWQHLARALRARVQEHWDADTSHPLYQQALAASPAGQCYVSAMFSAHALRVELGLDAKVALGSVWSADDREPLIPYHGWAVIGDPMSDPIVIDITADQTGKLPRVLAGHSRTVRRLGASYHYSNVARPDEVRSSSAIQRWLILTARAKPTPLLSEFRQMHGLDLTIVRDDDIRNHVDALLADRDLNDDGRYLVEVCRQLLDRYSFTGTRTYPRPDHPDPRKRRSLSFLLAGILISLRTTLENEQRATDALLQRCPDDDTLYDLSLEEIQRCIAPAGMAPTKAARIRDALTYVDHSFGRDFGGLTGLDRDDARMALLEVPGFGPKAADCFLSIGLGVPSAVVDVNVFRSFLHLFPSDSGAVVGDYSNKKSIDHVRNRIEGALPDDPLLYQVVHTMLLLFAKNRFESRAGEPCLIGSGCRRCADQLLPFQSTVE
jgi:endonuclease III